MSGSNTKEKTVTRPRVDNISRSREEVKTPSNYKVLLLNNPVTFFDAVVDVLASVFLKNRAEAQEIMWFCHQNGMALVMISTKEICDQKVREAKEFCMSKKNETLPMGITKGYEYLEFTVEKEDSEK